VKVARHRERVVNGIAVRIAVAAGEVYAARSRLEALLRENCCGPHRYVHHRDGRLPWCGVCRYQADGTPADVAPVRRGWPS
jgi:hypothetical protein